MIKLLIDSRKFHGGPFVFRNRISKALSAIDGIKVIRNHREDFDVELSIIRCLSNHGKPIILRLDGCYYDPSALYQNKEISSSIKKSKHIIFQSEFSMKMINSIIPARAKNCSIIHNGIDMNYISSIKSNPSIEPGSFVAVAKWRYNKRPMSTINGFVASGIDRKLYIIGDGIDNSLINRYKNVCILGSKTPEETLSIMKSCQYQIHLCHIDSCPNAVVEGLACGLNVLCTNLGGTTELVKKDGIILDIDRWNFIPKKFSNLDKIESRIVADGIYEILKKTKRADRQDLDINLVAQKYADIIKSTI